MIQKTQTAKCDGCGNSAAMDDDMPPFGWQTITVYGALNSHAHIVHACGADCSIKATKVAIAPMESCVDCRRAKGITK